MFTIVPILLVLVIQNLAAFFLLGIVALTEAIYLAVNGGVSFARIANDIMNLLTNTDFSACLMIIYAFICISLFGLWYYAKYDGNFRVNAKETFRPLSVLGVILLVPGMQYLTTYLVSFLSLIFPSWLEAYETLLESAGMDESISPLLLIYSVLLAPVAEELICRGVTLRQAKKVLPFWAANMMQALLFGAIHMNMMQGTYAFILGLILGFLCEKSGSLYMPFLFHILFNFFGTVLSNYITFSDTAFSLLFWFFFGLITTGGGIALFLAGYRKTAAETEKS